MIISIGTAQLGSSYGISNRSKKIRIKDFKKILDLAYEKGLHMWVVSDNLRKGAATNTIQIAEYLNSRGRWV